MDVRKYAAEAIGTFWLTFMGCGSAVLAATFPQVGIGLLGVAKPSLVWLGPLASHKDELATVLPPILTVVGGIWAWLSHPPAWIREPLADAVFWIKSFLPKRRPTP